jgi:hypothetical protein
MLRDNLTGLIEPMFSSAGAYPLALCTDRNKSSDDRPRHALKIPARQGGIYALTENVTSPFHAEPRHATIADAAKRGDLSSEQAREMSAEQYQLAHMQFELLSLWRGIEEQNLARIPDVEAKPDSTQGSEVVIVALPFSSFQLNPSLATYLSLTPSQVEAIQRVMMWEQHSVEPLMTQLRTTRERLLAIGSEHLNTKQVKALADTEASLLARLIVANARLQSKIFNILSAEQQKKLSDLERTQGALTSEGK